MNCIKFQSLAIAPAILIFTIGCVATENPPAPVVPATVNSNEDMDPELVGTASCRPPCWNGINPGETSFGMAVETLEDLKESGVGDYSVFSEDIVWIGSRGNYHLFHYLDEYIVRITIYFDNIPLTNIVSYWGDPNAFEINLAPHGPPHELTIYYPEQGMIIFSSGLREDDPSQLTQIPPEILVRMVMFIKKETDIQLFIDNYLASYEGESNIVEPTLYQWGE